MKRFIIAAVLFASPVYAKELPRDSLVCTSQARIDEAWKAIERSDYEWLRNVRGCYTTTTSAKAERLGCSGRTCQVRLIDGNGSGVFYTLRSYL